MDSWEEVVLLDKNLKFFHEHSVFNKSNSGTKCLLALVPHTFCTDGTHATQPALMQ